MPDIFKLENKIKQMIDEMKGLCQTNGLSNQASEEVVITSVFLYKFLNDKFMANMKDFAKDMDMSTEEVLKDKDMLAGFYDSFPQDVAFKYEDTIECLINQVGNNDFYRLFDDALERISNYPENEEFSIDTADGGRKPLFTRVTENVEASKRNNFAKNIFGIISQDKFDFGEAFKNNFDFYSAIFEHLIKDYNVASGVYAEYFTPQAISAIIAKILVEMSPVEDKIYDVYDPSAGSGSLVLHLANALGKGSFGDKAQVYTQDISGKSSRFLRTNMLLNGLTNSLDNIIEGDTLETPAHYKVAHDPSSGVKQFDYITSNPPFKMDFSSTRNTIEQKWEDSEIRGGIKRFFAGVPKIPNKKKESMGVYLCFIQHILWSLKEDGKAAIVVPTGFITAQSGIEKTVRQTIVDKRWLKGVISMPSNIFANTGTNVSVLFIDKSNKEGNIMLIDASKLGEKRKEGKNQRTVLRPDEVEKIEDTFINQDVVEDFSVSVTYEQIAEKNYSLSAGQYFEVKIEFVELSQEDFEKRMLAYSSRIEELFKEGKSLEDEIKQRLGELKYEKNNEIMLKDCIKLIIDHRGKTPSKLGGDWAKTGIRVISALNIHNGTIDNESQIRCVDKELYKKWMPDDIERNDCFIASEGASLGENCIWDSDEKIVLGQRLYAIRADENVLDAWYFAAYMQTSTFRQQIEQISTGSTVFGISQPTLLNVKLKLPDIVIQQYVGALYKSIKRKIENNNKINVELDSMSKTIYDYWFLQFEFPNEDGKPYKSSGGKMVWNEELRREIPEGWKSGRLNQFIKQDKGGDWGKEFPEGNYIKKVTCLRGADFPSICGNAKLEAPERFINEKNAFKILKKGDLIIEISGGSPTQSTGRICYINTNVLRRFRNELITSNFCKAINLIDEDFMYWFYNLWCKLYDSGVFFKYEGKTTGIKNLLFEMLCRDYPIIIPDADVIKKYNNKIEKLFEVIQRNLLENEELSSLRDFLLPLLMNGQVGFKE